jgi:hypothetical protein
MWIYYLLATASGIVHVFYSCPKIRCHREDVAIAKQKPLRKTSLVVSSSMNIRFSCAQKAEVNAR